MFKPLSRRHFLLGAAGAMMPLPFLNAMGDDPRVRQQPLRFVSLFKPNGIHPPSWNIEGATENDYRLSPMMAPFREHRPDFLIVDNMGTSGFSSHQASAQRFLSGRYAPGRPGGAASIDQLIADRISAGTRCRSLELTTESVFTAAPECSYISINAQGQPIPRERDPQVVFDRLFRDPRSSATHRREMSSLLDQVGDQARSLSRRVGREDRQTLEQYLSVVRQTERRIGELDQGEDSIDFDAFERPGTPRHFDEQVDLMLDVIALALWTDSTRCATYMLGNDNSRMVFNFLGVRRDHHFLSHYFRNFSGPNLDQLYRITRWHMEKFSGLLTRLKSYADCDGRLLDHCLVLFGAGMGESDIHTGQRIPTILAGEANGLLKTGRYLRHDRFRELSQLHRAILSMFGVQPPEGHHLSRQDELTGLDGGAFREYREAPIQTSLVIEQARVTVEGRMRFSDDLNQANQFFIDVQGEARPVRIQIPFAVFIQRNVPFYCGTPVRIVGQGRRVGDEVVVSTITSLESTAGINPVGPPNVP